MKECATVFIVSLILTISVIPSYADKKRKPAWEDPCRHKVSGKYNYVQIPLTAYEHHLLGNIHSVRYQDYKVKGGKRSLDDSGYNVYDRKGNLVNQTEYDAQGKVKWHCEYEYTSKNRPVKRILHLPEGAEIVTFEFDSKGNVAKEITKDTAGKVLHTASYAYDNKGNKTSESYQMPEGHIFLAEYTYNSLGYQTTRIITRDKATSKTAIEYDSLGNKAATRFYENDSLVASSYAQFDDLGRPISTKNLDDKGKVDDLSTTTYDRYDNVTASLKLDPETKKVISGQKAKYVYDTHGNATEETDYDVSAAGDTEHSFTEASYSYY